MTLFIPSSSEITVPFDILVFGLTIFVAITIIISELTVLFLTLQPYSTTANQQALSLPEETPLLSDPASRN